MSIIRIVISYSFVTLTNKVVTLTLFSPATGCTRYEAVFDFQGSHGNHLSFQQGDIVHVQRKEDTGWWRGSKGDKSGWFPSNYVQSAPPEGTCSHK